MATENPAAPLERRLRLLARNITGITSGLHALTEDDVHLLESSLDTARSLWHQYQEIYFERQELPGEFPTEAWYTQYDTIQGDLIKAGALLLKFKASSQRAARAREIPLQPAQESFNATVSGGVHARPQLPRIPIPSFSGDLLKWTSFRDTFTSLIHSEESLTNVEKFHYLLGALKGEAAALVSHFVVDDTSYEQAWEKVLSTYNNTRILASFLVQRLLECKSAAGRDNVASYDTFLTEVADSIEAFRALKLDKPDEFLLASLALRALDPETRRQFELSLDPAAIPSPNSVIAFVRQRRLALKMSQDAGTSKSYTSPSDRRGLPKLRENRRRGVTFHVATQSRPKSQQRNGKASGPQPSRSDRNSPQRLDACLHCKQSHLLFQCTKFLQLPLRQRYGVVQSCNACLNCLRPGHRVANCTSRFRCRQCGRKHHTLLHENSQRNEDVKEPEKGETNSSSFVGFGSTPLRSPVSATHAVLLGTAHITISGPRGRFLAARALLDSGSQHSFITCNLARKLGVKIRAFCGNLLSLGEATVPPTVLKGTARCSIRAVSGDKELPANVLVVESISSALPSHEVPTSTVQELIRHPLADAHFGSPGPIDVLIGADLYSHVITGAPQPSGVPELFLHPSIFGMVVTGSLLNTTVSSTHAFFLETRPNVEEQLRAFWELEEPTHVDRHHPDDIFCEEHFKRTHTRTPEGRYMVRLPFRAESPNLGYNRDAAFRRLYSLETKFRRDRLLAQQYGVFMQEYCDLGHMSPATRPSPYIIPHHGVWQEGSEGRKLRVVFDASCTSSTRSLNDLLHAGPKLQEDLCSILIRFRLHAVAICADLVKMYRQILIHPEDRHFQHVLWRRDPSLPVTEMELSTVTYGVKPSAFQALRVIRQLVSDEGRHFPAAAARIPQDMYVDDIVSGAHTIEEATKLVNQLDSLFARGGFELGKWASNRPEVLPPSSSTNRGDTIAIFPSEDGFIKILGLCWNPRKDSFSYVTREPSSENVTKRTMLSAIARIFDPLGLLAPVILYAKTLIQEVWKRNLDWDEALPADILSLWLSLTTDWPSLSSLCIPRYITNLNASIQIIGFCDASSKGYAATVYLRSENSSGEARVSLIKAKTKVAPLRFQSIARLELCGALLLARTLNSIQLTSATVPICFTDSEVVLSWLRTPIYDLQVFEANRVSQILQLVPLHCWRHVPSTENPADVASRGATPKQLLCELLWWSGPHWLASPIEAWFVPSNPSNVLALTGTSQPPPALSEDWTTMFSSYSRLLRTSARILGVLAAARARLKGIPSPAGATLSPDELLNAELRCISFVQHKHLPQALFQGGPIPKEFLQLSPFVDKMGIIRVGGRLHESTLPRNQKHPVLLPYRAHLSRILIDQLHSQNFHAGPSLCLSLLRNKYWIPRAAKLIRGRILRCVHCRLRCAKPLHPVMAPLPKERIKAARAFTHVGVDYAGPFHIKESRRRNAALGKAYLCLFICMSSKAVHLELVSSLSTPAFLAALDRFVARRGLPSALFSDHGSNFIGASRFLKTVFQNLRESRDEVQRHLALRGVRWEFIPPRAPHFGGLWEAGVKSVKALLAGTVGKQPLSFEELATILSKIEALLNSRPLCPLTEDASNFDFLTPGHFLVGAPLCSLPTIQDLPASSSSPLSRWKSVRALTTHLWRRWRKEYLHTLQQRAKWHRPVPGLRTGDLVVFIERRPVVDQWPVGRVVEAFPGRDGITRVVTVRTPSGTVLTRAASSLVPLFHPGSSGDL